jgi:hypothetical protein
MTVAELIERLRKFPPDVQVVIPDYKERGHVVAQAVITYAKNWMSDGKVVRVCYLNPPLRDLDNAEDL